MSNFLAVDTSSHYLTVLAQKGEKRCIRFMPECATQHSVVLMDEIDKALEEVELSPRDCDFFAAVTGPGSFTGIRIGIAAVKGLALGCDKPLVGVTSFDLIAYNAIDENFAVAIDALHNHYYVCGYGKKGKLSPAYMDGDGVRALGLPVYGFEDLPFENYTKLNVKDCLYPAICAVCGNLSRNISALYVRKSQAEEARNGT